MTAGRPESKDDESRNHQESTKIAEQKLDKINVNHINLGTPRSVEEISMIEDKQDRLKPKHIEMSFHDKEPKQEELEVKDGP